LGLNENVKLINKTYSTTREEKDRLTEALQAANEEIANMHESLRRTTDANKDLSEQVLEARLAHNAVEEAMVILKEQRVTLIDEKAAVEQQMYASNVENAGKITGLLEELEKYGSTIDFLESDKEEMIARNAAAMELVQSMFCFVVLFQFVCF
jgi:chromosome segregation ATPase